MVLFPRTARALRLALKLEHEFPPILEKGIGGETIAGIWFSLWEGVHLINRLLTDPPGDVNEVVICDSRSHSLPRCCSGCHLVVYCSMACQRDDWNERHKRECKSMKKTFDGRKRELVHYTHSNRHLHTRMVMEVFRGEYTSILSEYESGVCASANESILIIDASPGLDWPRAIGVMPMLRFTSLFFGRFDSPEMDARKDEIINDFVSEPSSTTKRLLAITLFWDYHRRIHLLVELVRDPSDPDQGSSYEVARSVVRLE
ncbi:hypothetical protein BKA70DRAFT_1309063 [Coprinopsis sp. MPI-PUGE-AT-0042]|nr:hypothetical protein BKA70DRAFT_1309063 [Coprinopsis sp. MPI-PUGE-AT-0042]